MTVPRQKVFPELLEEKEAEAIAYIRAHEPAEGYSVAYSGGKDSEVMLHLTQRSGVKFKAHYCNTTIDPPEVLKHIRRHHPEVKILRSEHSFWQWLLWVSPRTRTGNPTNGGLPLRTKKWCCNRLKKAPAKNEGNFVLEGIRAEESPARAKRGRTELYKKRIFFKPIFSWKIKDVWDYIEKYNLPFLPSYINRHCARVGCFLCPEQSPTDRLLSMAKYPGFWRLLRLYCDKLWKCFPNTEYIRCFKSGEELYEWWCSGKAEEEWRKEYDHLADISKKV